MASQAPSRTLSTKGQEAMNKTVAIIILSLIGFAILLLIYFGVVGKIFK